MSQDGKKRFQARSRSYVLGDSVITAARAAVALYESVHDSITHPGVELKYLKGKENLKLLQEDGTYRKNAVLRLVPPGRRAGRNGDLEPARTQD